MNMSASLKPLRPHDRLSLSSSHAAELRNLIDEIGDDAVQDLIDSRSAEDEGAAMSAVDIERLRDALAAIPWNCTSTRSDFDAAINWHGARLDELLARLRAAEPTEIAAR